VKVNDVSHVDRLTKKFDWSATNLVPANEPQDIYQEVADHVSRRVGRDAANSGGNDQDSARQLRGKIQRSVVVPGFGHGTHVAGLLRLIAPGATVWAMRVFEFVLRELGDLQQREEHRFAQSSLYGQARPRRHSYPGLYQLNRQSTGVTGSVITPERSISRATTAVGAVARITTVPENPSLRMFGKNSSMNRASCSLAES